jgi:hypothetical protein
MNWQNPKELIPHIKAGHSLIPLIGNNKLPRDKGWTKKAYDDFDASAHMASGNNVGVRLTSEMLVIDVDTHNKEGLCARDVLANLVLWSGVIPEDWPEVRTGSGGSHYYFRIPPGVSVVGKDERFPGIDFKTSGHVVAAGSVHPETGKIYEWDAICNDPENAPLCPEGLLELIRKDKRKEDEAQKLEPGEHTPKELEMMLASLDVEDFRIHEDWLRLMMACHHATAGAGREVFAAWSTSDPEYSHHEEEILSRWDSIPANRKGPIITVKTLYRLLHDAGAGAAIPRHAENDFDDDISFPEDKSEPEPLPYILSREGRRVEMVEEAKKALFRAAPSEILQRHGTLVRPVRLGDQVIDGGVRHSRGATVLKELNEPWLLKKMDMCANWYRRTQNKSRQGDEAPQYKRTRTDPSQVVARIILNDQGAWPFYHVRGMVTAPTVDVSTGEIVDRPGINPETGLLAVFDDNEFPRLKRGIDREAAKERLWRVHDQLFRDMPFADEPSRAVAMSALVTALVRPTMRTAPLHAFDAAMPGTGKSKMASIVGVVAMGVEPSASSWATSEEENEKRLSALLRNGSPVILFDNVDASRGDRLSGNMLNIVLTQDPASIRVLGKTEEAILNTRVMMMATGNNLAVVGDACRRIVKCRLDARCSEPEKRRFDWDPVEVARSQRSKIISGLLEALIAYLDAGRTYDPPPLGSFEDWTSVRGLLAWCGFADPADTVADVKATDEGRRNLALALETWFHAFDDSWISAAELETFLADEPDLEHALGRELLEGQDAMRDGLLGQRTSKNWIPKELLKVNGVSAGEYYLEVKRTSRLAQFRVVKQA